MTPQTSDSRVFWAKERTFLAWIRTGLALMGFGFVVARFSLFLRMIQTKGEEISPAHPGWSMWFGTFLIFLGVFVQLGSVIDYVRFTVKFNRGEFHKPKTSYLGIGVAICLILIGLVMAVYLITSA